MLNIVCLNVSNYQGRGKEYVEKLFDMVDRNLPESITYRFTCFTDDPEPYKAGIVKREVLSRLKGWWHKLYLFQDGLFPDDERIIYFDLDTCVVSALDEYQNYLGPFAILRDFYRHSGLQSSVMMWPSNSKGFIWNRFSRERFPQDDLGGDQAFIEKCMDGLLVDYLQDLYPFQFISYKISATYDIPASAHVVVFHGEPRPHEVLHNWVPHIWKIGGGSILHQKVVCNTADETVMEQIKNNLALPFEHLADQYSIPNFKHLCIVGGGPSLAGDLVELKKRQEAGNIIWALNNAFKYLIENDIYPDCQIMLDARPENAAFVPEETKATLLYASQCHPDVFAKAKGRVIIWDAYVEGILALLEERKIKSALIGGATTAGISALALAQVFGFRDVHLFGYDSSYREDRNHAYQQPLNDTEKKIVVTVNGQNFTCAPWMATQVQDFKNGIQNFLNANMTIHVHGNGLLPYVAKLMGTPSPPGIEKKGEYWWPTEDYACREVSESEARKEIPEILTHCAARDVCIQAGGNVGVWPRELSKYFGRVHTFEPDPVNFDCLVKNVEGINTVTATNAGLGDKAEFVGLHMQAGNCGAHFVKGDGQIPITTIDFLALPKCDLILLDVEGYEHKALLGAMKTIRRYKPVIVCEEKGLGSKYGTGTKDIEKLLLDIGYSIAKRISNDVIYTCKN